MRRTSGWLQGETGSNFVHVHVPSNRLHRTGVLIIPGLGSDCFHGYRGLRFLADSLCEQSFLSVRMEFTGTGNCAETNVRAGPDTWDNDVARVIAWLRQCQGIDRICVIANRTGALFLDSALQPGDDLILWGACSGRSWIREQAALRRLASSQETGNTIESGGLVLDAESTSEIAEREPDAFDNIRRLLILDRADRLLPAELRERIAAKAGTIEHRLDGGYARSFREPHNAERPDDATLCMIEWVGSACGSPRNTSGTAVFPESTATTLQFTCGLESVRHCSELFGILARPEGADTIVLLGNAGAVHHVGPNRLNVELARKLAGEGVATLRYDLSNLGDSVCAGLYAEDPVGDENHPYPVSAEHDISSLVNWARGEGFKRVILAGLCSGAYAAFDFARGRHTSAPDEVLLINPLTFQWRPGMSLEIPEEFRSAAQSASYRSAMADGARWRRLLTGKVSYSGLFKHLIAAMLVWFRGWVRTTGAALHLLPRPQLEGDLLRIAASGIRIRFYFSSNEPGIGMLNGAGRSCLDALRKLHLMSIEFIEHADHTFRNRNKRAELTDAILRAVGTTYDRSN